jgi:CRP/FNR family transcriptional regulator, cyclic AMP receptor protein
MRDEAATFISGSAWGRHLEPRDLARVLAAVRLADVPAGHCVVRAGEPAEHWAGLVSGLVVQQVSSESGRLATLTCVGPGAWFGEGTLMKRGCWQYDALARQHCRVALVPRSVFDWLLDSNLAFNQFLARLLNERLSHYMGLLANERLTSSAQRLAHVLASLYDPDLYPNRSAMLPMSQTDIALLSGMSRQHANAALHKLQTEGLLEVGRNGVRVLDVVALRRY